MIVTLLGYSSLLSPFATTSLTSFLVDEQLDGDDEFDDVEDDTFTAQSSQ